MPVDEVGTGVGYFDLSSRYLEEEFFEGEYSKCVGLPRATRFAGFGSAGGEEYSSKAGKRAGLGADRLTPATGGRSTTDLRGELFILS